MPTFRRSDHEAAPYADALVRHLERRPHMFMVPAHGATATGLSEGLAEFAGERAVMMDIPQLIDGIDVGAGSPFLQAEALAADAWSARRTWFLANGSSQGNRMAVMAVAGLEHGQVLVAQRSAHSSLTDGLIFAGLPAAFAQPRVDVERGINHGLTPNMLAGELSALARAGTPAKAAYIISPSYFGAISDIRGLAAVAHGFGVPLIVDAAWGAHFGFHTDLPAFPTTQGADVVVTSTHKMGGSLGQSAMIHLSEGEFADRLEPLIDRAFRLTQTTSASSLLLGSLDVARRSLMTRGDLLTTSMTQAEALREWVRRHPRLELVSDSFHEHTDIVDSDPLRVSIDVGATGLTGYEVRARLADRWGIFLEIATTRAVVAFMGPGKDLAVDLLQRALDSLRGVPSSRSEPLTIEPLHLPAPGPRRTDPRTAFLARSEVVPYAQAAGRISADALSAYPPGIPNVMPGEEITEETIAFLRAVAQSPIGYVRGATNAEVDEFRVLVGHQGDRDA